MGGGASATLELVMELRDEASRGMKDVSEAAGEATKSGGLMQNAFSFALGGFIQQGLGAGLGAVKDFFGGAMEEANEAAANMAQLDAVLTSTGGKAGVTKDQALALADSLSSANGMSQATDDAILAGENLLLTFTGIGADVFPEATKAMVDMSQALGQDVGSSAQMLGKALNDPVDGLSKLTRAGVVFTDEQKEMITSMAAAGDVAGAQKIMLQELATEFGGSAAAAAGTFEGKMMTLSESFNNVKQGVGEALMPILMQLADVFSSPEVMGGIKAVAEGLVGGIGMAVEFLMPLLTGLFDIIGQAVAWFTSMAEGATSVSDVLFNMAESVGGPLGAVLGFLSSIAEAWESFFSQVQGGGDIFAAFGELAASTWQALMGLFERLGPMLMEMLPKVAEFIGGLLAKLGEALPVIMAKLAEWGMAFINWVGPQIPILLGKLGELLGNILSWLGANLPGIIQQLGEWAKAFVDWVLPQIPVLLGFLGQLLLDLLGWLAANLPSIIGKLLEWALAFVGWVAPMIPQLLGALGGMLLDLLGWIASQIPALVGKLAEWGGAFLGWVARDVLPWIGAKLAEIWTAIWTWIGQTATSLATEIVKLATSFWTWITDVVTNIPGKIAEIATAIWTWITNTARDAATKALQIGKDLIGGILQGLKDAAGAIWTWLTGLLDGFTQGVKDFFGIKSPSTLMADMFMQVGMGAALGLERSIPGLLDAATNAMEGVKDVMATPVEASFGVGSLGEVAAQGGNSSSLQLSIAGLTLVQQPGQDGAELADQFIERVSQQVGERLRYVGVI